MTSTNPNLDNLNSMGNRISKIPGPSSTMIYFIVITLIYGITNIYYIYSLTTQESVAEKSNNQIFNLIYISLLLLGSYFININISKSLCNSNSVEWYRVFIITVIPYIVIFGALYLLLDLFSSWVNPFSNTIGYAIVNVIGLKSLVDKMISNDNQSIRNTIDTINKNKTKFINEIDKNNLDYEKFLNQVVNDNIFKKDIENDKIELFKHIHVKHMIGKLIWYILAGSLISAASYNYIINMKCSKTQEELDEEYNALYR